MLHNNEFVKECSSFDVIKFSNSETVSQLFLGLTRKTRQVLLTLPNSTDNKRAASYHS